MNRARWEWKPQLTLGMFIELLEKVQDKSAGIMFDFGFCVPNGHIDSYRGYYDHMALGFGCEYGTAGMTVQSLLNSLKAALGSTRNAWKGGDYPVNEKCLLWVANPGMTGSTSVVGLANEGYVVILTQYEDEVEEIH